jgi:hypothetical protein
MSKNTIIVLIYSRYRLLELTLNLYSFRNSQNLPVLISGIVSAFTYTD